MTSLSSSTRYNHFKNRNFILQPLAKPQIEPMIPIEVPKSIKAKKLHISQNLRIADNQMLLFSLKRCYKTSKSLIIKKEKLGEVLQCVYPLQKMIYRMKFCPSINMKSTPIDSLSFFELYNLISHKIKRFSLPIFNIIMVSELLLKTRLFLKMKRLEKLSLEIFDSYPLYIFSRLGSWNEPILTKFFYHLRAIKSLQELSFNDKFPMSHPAFMKTLAQFFNGRVKDHLKGLKLQIPITYIQNIMDQSYREKTSIEALNPLINSFSALNNLSKIDLSFQQEDINDKNIYLLAKSLTRGSQSQQTLRYCSIKLSNTRLWNSFLCLNQIPNLTLKLNFQLNKIDSETVSVLKQLECLLQITIDNMSNQDWIETLPSVSGLFNAIAEARCIKKFNFTDLSNFCMLERNTISKGLTRIFQINNLNHLESISLTFLYSNLLDKILSSLNSAILMIVSLKKVKFSIRNFSWEFSFDKILKIIKSFSENYSIESIHYEVLSSYVGWSDVKPIIDSLSKFQNLKHIKNLSLPLSSNCLPYYFQKIGQLKKLETCRLTLNNLMLSVESQPKITPSSQAVMEEIVQAISGLKNLEFIQIYLPIRFYQHYLKENIIKMQKKNPKLGIKIMPKSPA